MSRIIFTQNLFTGEGIGTEDCGRAAQPFPTCFWGQNGLHINQFLTLFWLLALLCPPSASVQVERWNFMQTRYDGLSYFTEQFGFSLSNTLQF